VLYPTDLLALAMNALFGLLSLANLGKARMSLLGMVLDRQLVMGLFFLLLDPLILLGIRLANSSRSKVVHFIRLFYVQALYMLYFSQSIRLSQLFFNGRSLDPQFAWLEQALFRCQPALIVYRRLGGMPLLNELMFFSYFSFYTMVTIGPWALYARRRHEEALRMLFVIVFSFFIFYTWYAFFPVQGPKYFFPELRALWYRNFEGFFFTRLMKYFFANMNLAGAAVPSSHVAMALVTTLLNWRDNRILFWIFLPLALVLAFSTVYLYAHYAIDSILGAATGVLMFLFVPRAQVPMSRAAARAGEWLGLRLGFPPIGLIRSTPGEGTAAVRR
jgi:membrane-associated phospholipid phosphatase